MLRPSCHKPSPMGSQPVRQPVLQPVRQQQQDPPHSQRLWMPFPGSASTQVWPVAAQHLSASGHQLHRCPDCNGVNRCALVPDPQFGAGFAPMLVGSPSLRRIMPTRATTRAGTAASGGNTGSPGGGSPADDPGASAAWSLLQGILGSTADVSQVMVRCRSRPQQAPQPRCSLTSWFYGRGGSVCHHNGSMPGGVKGLRGF